MSSAAGGVAAGDGPEPPAEAPLSESEVRESDSLEEAMVSPDAATRTRDEWLALRASLDALVQAHAESRLAARWEYLALVVTCPDGEACTEPDAAVVRERSARLEALEQRHPGDPIVVAGALRVADVTSRAHRFVAAAHALEIGRRAIAGAPERQRELDVRVARVELALRMTEVVGLGTAGREYTRWVTELSAELEDLRDAIRRERESVPDASSVSDTTIAMVGEVVLCFPTYADLDPDSFTALVATIGLERLEIARVAIVLGHVALARGENGARPLRILRDAQVIADDTVSLTTDDVASIAGLVCATRSPLSAIETRAMEARGLVTPLACPQNAGLDRQVAMRVLYEVHFELNACRSAPPTRGDPPAAPIARISADEAGSPTS